MYIGVNLSPSEWNSRLHKQSPPARTKKIECLKPTQVSFVCVDAVSNRPFNVKLTPMIDVRLYQCMSSRYFVK